MNLCGGTNMPACPAQATLAMAVQEVFSANGDTEALTNALDSVLRKHGAEQYDKGKLDAIKQFVTRNPSSPQVNDL